MPRAIGQSLVSYPALYSCSFSLQNEKFYAHKVVVAAWSPALYNLLADGQTGTAIIRVQYDNAEIFASLLAFLYCGEVDVAAEDNLIQVKKTFLV